MTTTSSLGGDILQEFARRLLEEKKFENVDAEVKAQLESDLIDRIENRVNVAILEKMPKDQIVDFESLLETGTDEEIQNFCQNNVEDFQNVVAQALLDFRAAYLGLR